MALISAPSNYFVYWFYSLMETLLCWTILEFNNRNSLEIKTGLIYTYKCIKGNESQTKPGFLPYLEQNKSVQMSEASPILSNLITFKDLFSPWRCGWENKHVFEGQDWDYLCSCFLFMDFKQLMKGLIHLWAVRRECVMVVSHFQLRSLLKPWISRFKVNQLIYENGKNRRHRQNKHKQIKTV